MKLMRASSSLITYRQRGALLGTAADWACRTRPSLWPDCLTYRAPGNNTRLKALLTMHYIWYHSVKSPTSVIWPRRVYTCCKLVMYLLIATVLVTNYRVYKIDTERNTIQKFNLQFIWFSLVQDFKWKWMKYIHTQQDGHRIIEISG